MYTLPKIERFNQAVLSKYHIYNSVFITLPFDSIDNTGSMASVVYGCLRQRFQKAGNPERNC